MKTTGTIVEHTGHAVIVLGPLGFHAQCTDGHEWASELVHGKHQARAMAQQHDTEHADDCAICVPGQCPGPGECPGNYATEPGQA